MTDPRGQNGTLVPREPSAATPSPASGRARTPGAPAVRHVRGVDAHAGGQGSDGRVPQLLARRQSADALRDDEHPVRLDVRRPVNRITQSADTIKLQYGQYGFERTIHMNAEHPANIAPTRAGHSIGRWENDVLVVDTVGFAPGVLTAADQHSDSCTSSSASSSTRRRRR